MHRGTLGKLAVAGVVAVGLTGMLTGTLTAGAAAGPDQPGPAPTQVADRSAPQVATVVTTKVAPEVAAQVAARVPAQLPGKTAGKPADKVAFDRLVRQQQDAWRDESGAGFAATFHPEADVVTFNGDLLSGREGIARGMQHYFDTSIEATTFRTLSEQIRYVEPDLAVIIRTSCLVTAPATTCRDDSLSVNTNVMHKRHGRWLQTSFQNTRVSPLG